MVDLCVVHHGTQDPRLGGANKPWLTWSKIYGNGRYLVCRIKWWKSMGKSMVKHRLSMGDTFQKTTKPHVSHSWSFTLLGGLAAGSPIFQGQTVEDFLFHDQLRLLAEQQGGLEGGWEQRLDVLLCAWSFGLQASAFWQYRPHLLTKEARHRWDRDTFLQVIRNIPGNIDVGDDRYIHR